METTISSDTKICTLINVFTVEPGQHQELLDLLKRATEEVMSKFPGYISANLHSSDDKKTLTNYAQWASLEDFEKMQQNAEAQKHMKKAASIAKDFKPATYDSIWTHSKK